MKHNAQRYILTFYAASALCALGIIIFLVIETQFFVVQARELMRLKKDYVNYTLALKRIISECKTDEADHQVESKKKINEDEFLVVNRDRDYLCEGAVAHAKKYHIEDLVKQVYYAAEWHIPDVTYPIQKRHLRKKTQAHILAIDNNIMALRAEYPFICPLERGTYHFSSRFGPRRRANGTWGFHYGLDMAAPKGTPVKAAAHGVVLEAKMTKGFGNMVLISHSNKLKTRYAHLSKIDVQSGDLVEQGQCVGRVGNTGFVRGKNGIHLHFEVLIYGKPINPSYFL